MFVMYTVCPRPASYRLRNMPRLGALLVGLVVVFSTQTLVAQQAAAPAQQQAKQPFPPLNAQQQAQLDQVLLAWQAQSQGTKTLECGFERWHFDLLAAPAGVHASWARGEIKYAKPDKGLFRVNDLAFYKGMKEGKPQFGPAANKYGEYWICNGIELVDYDRTEKKCHVHVLPPNMQGQGIFNSPLPFVFNLDAQQIKQRYWIKLEDSSGTGCDHGQRLAKKPRKTARNTKSYRSHSIQATNRSCCECTLPTFIPSTHPSGISTSFAM